MTVRRAVVMAIISLAAAGAATGCGSRADDPPPPAPASAARPSRAVVVGATGASRAPAASREPGAPAATAHQALERFTKAYINWTYRTIAADRARLAREATGDASVGLQRSAAQSRDDYELQAGKVANSGEVIAISPQRGAGAERDSWVVVTRERQHAAGTYDALPATYHVTIATVEPVGGGGWAVSHWEPQS